MHSGAAFMDYPVTSPEPEIDDEDFEEIEREIEAASSAETTPETEEPAPSGMTPTGANPSRRLSRKEWEECVILWESGKYTLDELARRVGIKTNTLQQRMKAAGIIKGSRAVTVPDPKAETIQDKIDAIQVKRVSDTKEMHYQYAEALAKLTIGTVVDCRNKKQRFATIDKDIAALGKAAKTLEIIRKERFAILGLDKDNMLDPEDQPEFMISEMTEDQIKEVRDHIEQGLVDEDLAEIAGMENEIAEE